MKKKLLSLFVAAIMVLSVLPLGALAAPAAGEPLEKAPAETAANGNSSLCLWDFETDPEADGWQFIDSDGDGYNWTQSTQAYHSGANSIMSESYNSGTALTPDNWAVSPEIELPEEGRFELWFYLRNANNDYQEKYTVYVGTSDDIESMTQLTEERTVQYSSFYLERVDLTAYAGQSVFLAFRHNGTTDIYKFYIDDVEIKQLDEGYIFGSYFEQNPSLDGWTYVDADGDGAGWGWYATAGFAYEGGRFLSSASTGKTPDNWAIVGPIYLADYNNLLSFYARGLGSITPDETFAVYIGESRDTDSMSELIPETVTTNTYTEYTANLDEYANREVYIAVRHFNSDNKYYLAIDQFEVYGEYFEYVPEIDIIDFDIPEWGANPDFEVSVPEGAPYSVELVEWFDDNGAIDEGYIFESEELSFHAAFKVVPEYGYIFSANTRVFINGSEELVNFYANECADNGTAFHTESVPFTVEREIITEVEIEGFTAPVNGENPFYAVTAPEGANYSIGETNWYCGDDLVEPGTPFVFGNTYWMEIELIPNYGYKFGDELTASVNGDEALVDEAVVESPESAWVITVELEVAAAVINAVELLDFDIPELGALVDFDFSVPEGAGYTIESVTWFSRPEITGPGEYMPLILEPGDTFDLYQPEYYDVRINIVPNEGYRFAYEVSATINGEESLVSSVSFNSHHHITVWSIEFSFERELIEEVAIEGFVEPVWGEAPNYDVTVPEGANYTVDEVQWFYWDGEEFHEMEEGELFDNEEYEYFMTVTFAANYGYRFANGFAYAINGEEYSYEDFDFDKYGWEIYLVLYGNLSNDMRAQRVVGPFTVTAPELIEEVAIEGFVEPVWGEAPNYDVTVPEGANYTISEVRWIYYAADGSSFGNEMQEGELFDKEDVVYYMEVTFIPNDGYKFAAELSYTVNGGSEYEESWTATDYDLAFLMVLQFTVTAPDAPELLWGDADGDGEVTTADALLLMRYLIGSDTIDEENLEWCDVNGDGKIDLMDALLIMRKAMGSIECFPVEE